MAKNKDNFVAGLIARSQKGDGDAFGTLIGHYRRRLFTYLVRICGEKELAEDMFQETLYKAWRYLPKYHHKNKFASWLFSLAHNVAIDALRRRKARDMVFYTEEVPECPGATDPSSEVLANEMQKSIEHVLLQLPEKQRQVFLLRQHSDMTFKEISEMLGQPLNTVLSHMHYAVSRLKTILREQDED
jgi:RNA polymerase sigma-70 factor (ECF subfamily)